MSTKPHPDFMKAGKIAGRVIEEVVKKVKPGVRVIKICSLAEKKILEYGAHGMAFPCNVSINDEAAHYTSPRDGKRVFPDVGLVKIDLGAQVNGHLSDTAYTVDLDGSYDNFIVAAQEALEAAIGAIRPGVRLGEVGARIEKTIKKHNLTPVHQLSGHQLKPWILHAGKNVPNIGQIMSAKMNIGETYAVEPFATDGNGTIKSGGRSYIFSNIMKSKKKLDRLTLRVRNIARKRFGTLPWSPRWLPEQVQDIDICAAVHSLERAGVIRGYPVLLEGKNGMVSQFEHSIFVGDGKTIVSTRRPEELST